MKAGWTISAVLHGAVLAWGLVVLVIHLVLYPWPAIIPDLKDLHDTYQQQRPHQQLQPPPGTPPSPYAP